MVEATSRTRADVVAIVIALAVLAAFAGIDVRVDYDKAFDFAAVQTWAWNPDGPGQVKMARTSEDDPEAMRMRVEPLIVEAVAGEMTRRSLQVAASTADLVISYYLLLSTGMSAQTIGQFVPATPEWGLPPLAPSTQSLDVINRGSLVLDMTAAGRIVWRGVAKANIKVDANDRRREALIREAVRDLFRRFPVRATG